MQTLTRLLFLLSCALLLGGCAGRPTPATTPPATQAAAALPTATATLLPTEAPAATATPRPSATPAPTATALPTTTPTATPPYCPDETPAGTAGYPLRVYFAERGDLRMWDEATDTTETLAEGGVYRLYLSPDGETVAFLRQEQPGMISGSKQMTLWAVDAGGGNERLLVGGDQFRAMGPARIGEFDVLAVNPLTLTWLPGAQELAFRVYASINALGNTTEPEIRLVDTATGAQRVLLAEGVGAFTFSPDGQRMTLADDDGIDLLDVGGDNRLADVVAYPTVGVEAVWYPMPVWADDGRTFSISIPSANLGDGKETLTVWEVAADDGAARELATFDGFPLPFAGNVGSAIFSPDQAEIAFYHTPERSNEGVLVVADVRGEWQAVYDAGWGPRFLGWAPDGSRFAYVVGQGQRGLLRIGRLCERPSVFDGPPPAGDTPVRWIDGERFLYQAQYGSAGPTTLLLGALDGTVREIGQLSERQDSFAFSEIGQYESEAFGFQFAIPSGYVVVEYDHPDALQNVSLYKRVLLANVRGPLPEIFVTVHQNEDGLSVGDWFAAHMAETMTDTYPVFVNPRNVRAERFAGRAALSFEDMTWSHGFVTLVEAEGAILKIGYTSFAYPGLADAFEHVRQSLTFMEE